MEPLAFSPRYRTARRRSVTPVTSQQKLCDVTGSLKLIRRPGESRHALTLPLLWGSNGATLAIWGAPLIDGVITTLHGRLSSAWTGPVPAEPMLLAAPGIPPPPRY